jgi:hypothetical protein
MSKKPPCIRGLAAFRKGCPQHSWNGATGCPAWVETTQDSKGGAEKIRIAECIDLYRTRLAYHANVLLEGNQQGIESFRNGMLTMAGGKAFPKPDPAVAKMALALDRLAQKLFNSSRAMLPSSLEDKG